MNARVPLDSFHRLLPAVTVLIVVAGADPASARTWYITPDGTGDAPTIQAGIDSAAAGDVVELAMGVFTESLVMKSGITLRGTAWPPPSSIVHAVPGASCVLVEDATDVLIQGIEFTGGTGTLRARSRLGGGILCMGSDVVIRDAVVRDCHLSGDPFRDDYAFGGGIACMDGSTVLIEDCTIQSNSIGYEPKFGPTNSGGGVYCDAASSTVVRSSHVIGNGALFGGGVGSDNPEFVFEDGLIEGNFAWGGGGFSGRGIIRQSVVRTNSARGTLFTSGGGLVVFEGLVEKCLVVGNTAELDGGGIEAPAFPGPVVIRGNTIYGNYASDYGSGLLIELEPGYSQPVTVENNIVAMNLGETWSFGVASLGGCPPDLTLRCNDVWGNAGGDYFGCPDPTGTDGNLSEDPRFCGAATGDFTLDARSPCLPGENPYGVDCGLVGAFGYGCGTPTATIPSSWGALKVKFR